MEKKKTKKTKKKVVAASPEDVALIEVHPALKDGEVVKHLSPGETTFAIKDMCTAIIDIRERINRIVEAHEKCKSLKNL